MASSMAANLAVLAIFLISATSTLLVGARLHHKDQSLFPRCFLNKTHGQASAQILPPSATSFNTVYLSDFRNLRPLLTPGAVQPSFIVIPTTNSHVQAAVTCGQKYGLRIHVRSGGHDYESLSSISYGDPFILLDISNFQSVTVNNDATAWVGAGATIGELAYYISQKNSTMGFPISICTTVGVSGLLSGGGIGSLLRKYGTAADNIIDAIMVDANGHQLNRASMGEDLFWALRGGGAASFGVVLSYKIKLVYVPPTLTVFNITGAQDPSQMMYKWQNMAPMQSEDIWIRAHAHAAIVNGSAAIQTSFQGMFLGTTDEFLPIVKMNFPELGLQAKDCIEMNWVQSVLYYAGYPLDNLTMLLDRRPNHGIYFKAKSDFVRDPIDQDGWESIWNMMLQASDEPVMMIFEPWGGKLSEIPENAIAFPHRMGNLFGIQYFLLWYETDQASINKHLDWMRTMYDFMAPYVSKNPRAAYLNYRDFDLGQNNATGNTSYSVASVWGNKYYLDNFKMLAQVKARVDPGNYFRNEQSIPPYSGY